MRGGVNNYTEEEKRTHCKYTNNSKLFQKRPTFNYDDFSEETLNNQDLIGQELWVWNHELIPIQRN